MNETQVNKNIRLYRLYLMFSEPLLWGPILILTLIHLGKMSLSEIYLMESVVLLGFIVLEIPSGSLADLLGRKKIVVIGTFLHFLSIIWFSLINSAIDVWGANILWMVSASLVSGADTSLIYDSLKEVGREGEYKKIHGEAVANKLLLTALCALVAGALAEINLRLPLLLCIPGILIPFLASIVMSEPVVSRKYNSGEHLRLMKSGIVFVFNQRAVLWIIGFSTLIGVASKVWFFTYNPYFELVDLDVKYFGFLFFLLNLVAWFFCRHADTIGKKISERNTIILMISLIGLPILFMGSFVMIFSVSMVLLQNVVRGLSAPFFSDFLHRHLDSKNRATVVSIKSAVVGLTQFLALGSFGLLLNVFDLPACLQILGITVLLLGMLSIWKYHRVFG